MSVLRVLVNSPATLQETFYGDETEGSGAATAAVTVTKADGSSLTSGTANRVGSTGATYQFVLNPVATLELLTVSWTATVNGVSQTRTSTVEIVGGFHVALSELRAEDSLSSTTDFSTDKLRAARSWFETRFENYTRRAWVPRYKRLTMYATGEPSLTLPDIDIRTIRSIKVDGVTLAPSVLTALAFTGSTIRLNRGATVAINASTALAAPFGYAASPLVVAYEYGADSCPDDIREVALIAIRSKLLQDNSGRPQLSVATADGIVRFAYPGEGRPFGIPEVDVVANDRRRKDDQFESIAMNCG